jgi:hypothetical protein
VAGLPDDQSPDAVPGQRKPASGLIASLAAALTSSTPRPTAGSTASPAVTAASTNGPAPTALAAAIGGVRGMIDSSVPALVFVVANAIGGLRDAVIAAVAVGVLIFVLRLVRREPVTQAFYGFLAVAVAAYLAHRTGKAQNFFLPGIALNAMYGAIGLVSLIVGHPLAGYVIAALDARYEHWRSDRALRRVAALATLTWTSVFALRVVVQGLLYLAGSTGWLAVAKIGMGWPLWGIALAITLWLMRGVRAGAPSSEAGEPELSGATAPAALAPAAARMSADSPAHLPAHIPGPDSAPSAVPPSNAAS